MKVGDFRPMKLKKPLKRYKKSILVGILRELIPPGKPLGFDEKHIQNKRWLLYVIHTLKAEHEMFTGGENGARFQRKLPESNFSRYILE